MITIKPRILDAVYRHAIAEYPSECCGIVTGKKSESESFEMSFPCRNLQNEMHAKDPKRFPRTSATAYFLDPNELFKIQKIARERGMEIKIIYHSHVNVGAYFSEEDKRQATYEGSPLYHGVFYLVIDVAEKMVRSAKIFGWDTAKKDFVEFSLKTD